jgi:hypothetical protein
VSVDGKALTFTITGADLRGTKFTSAVVYDKE